MVFQNKSQKIIRFIYFTSALKKNRWKHKMAEWDEGDDSDSGEGEDDMEEESDLDDF